MKKLFYLFGVILILTSCRTTYVEVYHIQKEPITWCETIYCEPIHWHFKSNDNEWNCVEIPADTIDIILNDTITEKIYMGTYKKKEHKLKWDIKNCCNNGK